MVIPIHGIPANVRYLRLQLLNRHLFWLSMYSRSTMFAIAFNREGATMPASLF